MQLDCVRSYASLAVIEIEERNAGHCRAGTQPHLTAGALHLPPPDRLRPVGAADAGDALFLRLRSAAGRFDGRLREGLTEDEAAALASLLDRLAENVARKASPAGLHEARLVGENDRLGRDHAGRASSGCDSRAT